MLLFEQIYYDINGLPDRQTLRACALVCSTWSLSAQQLLFHDIRVPDDEDRFKSFSAALYASSERGRMLLSFVRRAEVVIATGRPNEWDLVDLINHCHHLYELRLRVTGVHMFKSATLEALSSVQVIERSTPIRALALLSCGIQSPIIYQLLAIWPTIRFLRLGTELAASPPCDVSTTAQLYELVLHRIPCIEGMEWLLSASQGSLRILECNTAPSAKYDRILAVHAEQLQSLRLFRHTPRSAALIRQCTHLREVMFTHLSDFLPLGELPETLEHITFRYLPGVATVVPWSMVAAIDKLPRLRLVSCDASAWQAANYPALLEKCSEKHIVLDHDVVSIRTVSLHEARLLALTSGLNAFSRILFHVPVRRSCPSAQVPAGPKG